MLRKSIGVAVATDCVENLVVHIEADGPAPAVQFTLDYSRALGVLTDGAGNLPCHWLVPGGLYAFADIDRKVHFAAITLDPFPRRPTC